LKEGYNYGADEMRAEDPYKQQINLPKGAADGGCYDALALEVWWQNHVDYVGGSRMLELTFLSSTR